MHLKAKNTLKSNRYCNIEENLRNILYYNTLLEVAWYKLLVRVFCTKKKAPITLHVK